MDFNNIKWYWWVAGGGVILVAAVMLTSKKAAVDASGQNSAFTDTLAQLMTALSNLQGSIQGGGGSGGGSGSSGSTSGTTGGTTTGGFKPIRLPWQPIPGVPQTQPVSQTQPSASHPTAGRLQPVVLPISKAASTIKTVAKTTTTRKTSTPYVPSYAGKTVPLGDSRQTIRLPVTRKPAAPTTTRISAATTAVIRKRVPTAQTYTGKVVPL